MKPGKTYFPVASITSAPAGAEIRPDPRDRFAFAKNVGDVARVGGDDLTVLDQKDMTI